MIEALRPVMEKLKEAFEDPRAKKIQSWVEKLSSDPDKAKLIHNKAIDYLKKYNNKKLPNNSDEFYKDAVQVANFINDNGSDFPPFSKDIYTTNSKIDMGADKNKLKEQVLDYSREILIASLFSVNRLGLGDRLSKTMELDQIQAVIKCVVDNNHIQMGTGQGKSSTVIPIVSIINSLTSQEKQSLVISINKNLVSELETKTRELITKTKENGRELAVIVKNESKEEPSVGEKTKIQMMREALKEKTAQEYSDKTKNDLFATYWGEEIDTKLSQARQLFELPDSDIKITFMSKDDFVFKVTQGGTGFVKSCPKVFFDEVDAPYIIGETYQTTQEDMYISPESFRQTATQYVLNHLVMSKMVPSDDFEVFKGKGTASDKAKEKLMNINWMDWIDGKVKDEEITKAFEASIDTIGNFLQYGEAEKFGLQQLIKGELKEKIFVGSSKLGQVEGNESPLYVSVTGAADNMADAYHSLNTLYINEGEKIVVRSSYFDQLLENHKFEPDIHLAMLALVNKFSIVNPNPKAAESTKFPTIISELGNRLIGFSGTLTQRDLRTGKSQASSLAGLLREYTGHEVFEVRPPETKKPPEPTVIENIEQMEYSLLELIKSSKDGKSTLILSHYDIETTKKIFAKLSEAYQETSEVEMLPSIPSDPKRLEKYYQELKEKTKSLANGKIKILVSTGSAGIGADIVETSGNFPDLKIGILGLPENESLIRQNLGRRRKTGDDSFWIVDRESLRERATWLDDQVGMLFKANLTTRKALEQIEQLPYKDTERNLNFVLRLIHDAHTTTLSNEEFAIDYDRMFERSFVVRARRILNEIIKNEYFDKSVDWEKDTKSQAKLAELTKLFGLPDTLYNDLNQAQLTLGIQAKSPAEFMVGLNTNIEQQHTIETRISEWFERTRQDVEFMYKFLYGDGKQNINQLILNGSPKDAIFELHDKIMVHHLDEESREVEIGYATLPSAKFPKAVPAVRFNQEGQESIYLIGNANIGQMRKIKRIYSYEKGDNSYLFAPVAV